MPPAGEVARHVKLLDRYRRNWLLPGLRSVNALRSTPAAEFVYRVLTQMEDRIQQGGYYFWDPLAAAVASDPSLARFQDMQLVVIEKEGPESGRTIESEDGQMIKVAIWADADRFKRLFLDSLHERLP